MDQHVTPSRPHLKLTDDGRPVREILTYSRRGSRFGPRQQKWWDEYGERYWIPDERVDEPGFSFADQFPHPERPLFVEIGCGIGEATAELAASRPEANVLGFEVWRPGVAECCGRAGERGLDNLRMSSVDAVWSVTHLIDQEQLAGLWTFFPDPWQKARHSKRRLVNPAFAAVAASRLAVGAEWRLATDWAEYAEMAREVLDAEPLLQGGVVERWDARPVTRFERRGVREGREIVDLAYRRV